MATTQENVQNAVEAIAAEQRTILVELTDAQVSALVALDQFDNAEKIASNALSSAIKGKFKYMRDNLHKILSEDYDKAMRRGFKIEESKDSFLAREMKTANEIFNRL